MTNTAVSISSVTRDSFDHITLVSTDASANTYTASFNLLDTGLSAPLAPALAGATTGGTYPIGTFQVKLSYVNASGESAAGVASSVTFTTATSSVVVTSPAASQDAVSYSVYVNSLAAPTVFTRYQVAAITIGTPITLTTPNTAGTLALSAGTADVPVTQILRALFAS